jgi:hypothetical protein
LTLGTERQGNRETERVVKVPALHDVIQLSIADVEVHVEDVITLNQWFDVFIRTVPFLEQKRQHGKHQRQQSLNCHRAT